MGKGDVSKEEKEDISALREHSKKIGDKIKETDASVAGKRKKEVVKQLLNNLGKHLEGGDSEIEDFVDEARGFKIIQDKDIKTWLVTEFPDADKDDIKKWMTLPGY